MKNFSFDDLRASNNPESVTRMMDRHFTVDPDAQMLIASFESTPKSEENPAFRQCRKMIIGICLSFSLRFISKC